MDEGLGIWGLSLDIGVLAIMQGEERSVTKTCELHYNGNVLTSAAGRGSGIKSFPETRLLHQYCLPIPMFSPRGQAPLVRTAPVLCTTMHVIADDP